MARYPSSSRAGQRHVVEGLGAVAIDDTAEDFVGAVRRLTSGQAIIVELKTVQQHSGAHSAQCLNYLRATGLHLCLLMNFGRPRLEVRRIVHDL